MSGIYDAYMIGGVAVAATTVWGFMRTIRKVDKKIAAVDESGVLLKNTAVKMQDALSRHDESNKRTIAEDVESYSAVKAANDALQEVMRNSTQQLADAAVQVARSTEELRQTRIELEETRSVNTKLQARVATLEAQVVSLNNRLEYFTNPPKEFPHLSKA